MTDILRIERAAVRAVPATEVVTIDNWQVAIGRGQLHRTNSVTTFGIVPWDALAAIERVERRYRARGRTASFRLTELDSELDDLLFARGYERSNEVVVMSRAVTAEARRAPEVDLLSAATPSWLTDLEVMGGYTDMRVSEIGEGLSSLTLPHRAFRIPERAVGLAVADGDTLGLFDIAVHPDSRRAGYGRAISETMLAWGYEQGSALAYLQVLATNEPAVDMYRSMGFGEAYRYWYRDR